jgi:hypothetical protein
MDTLLRQEGNKKYVHNSAEEISSKVQRAFVK